MIEVNINYATFGFNEEQLARLNALLAEVKVKRHKGDFEEHSKSIQAVVTTRWSDDD